jgi:hypothetical protein
MKIESIAVNLYTRPSYLGPGSIYPLVALAAVVLPADIRLHYTFGSLDRRFSCNNANEQTISKRQRHVNIVEPPTIFLLVYIVNSIGGSNQQNYVSLNI